MTAMSPGWDTLARVARARRERLGLTQSEIEHRGGPSATSLRNIERGYGPFRVGTLRNLEKALDWEPSTAKCLVTGDLPVHHSARQWYVEVSGDKWFEDFVADSINMASGDAPLQAPGEAVKPDRITPLEDFSSLKEIPSIALLEELRRRILSLEEAVGPETK